MLLRSACRPVIVLLATVALVAGCGSTHRAEGRREATLDAVAGMSVDAKSVNGEINVTADPAFSEVRIVAEVRCGGSTMQEARDRLASFTIAAELRTDRTLVVAPVFPGGRRSGDGASFTIEVPSADGLELTSGNGRITVDGTGGDLVARTSNGRIIVQDHDGPIDAVTSNGRIEIDGATSDVKVVTSNGRVKVAFAEGHAGRLDVRTSNGSVTARIQPIHAGRLVMSTSNGDLELVDPRGACRAETISSRRLELRFGDAAVESSITTSNGDVTLTVVDDTMAGSGDPEDA